MKLVYKFISVIIVIAVLYSTAYAYNEEILFRGLPWLTDAETYADAVRVDMLDEESARMTKILTKSLQPSDFESFYDSSDISVKSYLQFDGLESVFPVWIPMSPDRPNIAEYPVRLVSGFALSGFENGQISGEVLNSRTVYMTYIFDSEKIADLENAYYDLHSKLYFKYGEPSDSFSSNTDKRAMWLGANDTYVVLSYRSNLDTLELSYGKTTIAALADEIKAVYGGLLDGL